MAKVIVGDLEHGDNFESALKRFKKKVIEEHIIQDYRKKDFYVSKGEKARAKRKEAIRRAKKYEKMENNYC